MTSVWMIRHGRPVSAWNEGGDDPGLDAIGQGQALEAAQSLLALPAGPARVISSPLRRCRETAQPLADALGVAVEIDPRVGEIPTPADLPSSERPAWLRAAFAATWDAVEGDLDYRQWRDGVARGVWEHAGCAVFSHYVAINAALGAATASEQVICLKPDHASITRFAVTPGGLALLEAGREASTSVL
jgi:broad specificity phosphatase PhoE